MKLSPCCFTRHIYIFRNLRKTVIQNRPVLRCYCQNRTIYLCIMQFADNGIHSGCQLCITITEIIYSKFIYMVAFHNSIYMRLNATTKEATVILTCFHHYCKISQLCRTFINVQAMKVIFYNTCHRFTGSITIRFINLHQYIKHINKNMARTRAWIYNLQLFWCQ